MYNYSKFKFIKYYYAKLIINIDIYKMQFISKYIIIYQNLIAVYMPLI